MYRRAWLRNDVRRVRVCAGAGGDAPIVAAAPPVRPPFVCLCFFVDWF